MGLVKKRRGGEPRWFGETVEESPSTPRKRGWTPIVLASGVLASFAIILLLMWLVPHWWVPNQLPESERIRRMNEARVPIAAGLAAVGTVWALYYTARTHSVTRRNSDIAERAQRETARLAEHGQNIDRYNKAVELLSQPGKTNVAARLGGIYALEALATDSARYRQTVVDVLCAFVRHQSHAPREVTDTIGRLGLAVDVQAACTVLTRLSQLSERGDWCPSVDLAGAKLESAELSGAIFHKANLRFTVLESANLNGVQFKGADLQQAKLARAKMDGADLTDARLTHADLRAASLQHAKASHVKGRQVRLEGADLRAASFRHALLAGASFGRTPQEFHPTGRPGIRSNYMEDTDFSDATLNAARFTGLDLSTTRGLTRGQVEVAFLRGCALPEGLGDTDRGNEA